MLLSDWYSRKPMYIVTSVIVMLGSLDYSLVIPFYGFIAGRV